MPGHRKSTVLPGFTGVSCLFPGQHGVSPAPARARNVLAQAVIGVITPYQAGPQPGRDLARPYLEIASNGRRHKAFCSGQPLAIGRVGEVLLQAHWFVVKVAGVARTQTASSCCNLHHLFIPIRAGLPASVEHCTFPDYFLVQERARPGRLVFGLGVRPRLNPGVDLLEDLHEENPFLDKVHAEIGGNNRHVDVAVRAGMAMRVRTEQDHLAQAHPGCQQWDSSSYLVDDPPATIGDYLESWPSAQSWPPYLGPPAHPFSRARINRPK